MNRKKLPFLAKPLLTFPSGTTANEIEDIVRRVIPASLITYRAGKLILYREAILLLARAVLNGRIDGNPAQARVMIEQITSGAVKPGLYLSVGTSRDICKDIIEGREEGNVTMAREYLAMLDRDFPER